MNESLRRAYLEAMGISVWYARSPLPGAAASPAFPLEPVPGSRRPEPVADKEVVDKPVAPEVRPERVRPGKLSRLAESQPQDRSAEPAPASVPDKTVADADRRPSGWERLDLGVWQGSGWMLVADWDAQAGARLQDQLARNVLRAMGETEFKAGRLQWPPFRHPDIPGNDRHSLARALDHLVGERHPPGLIVLGADSGKLVDSGPWPGTPSQTVHKAFTLSAMAGDAGLTRLLWASLRELKGAR